MPVKTMSCNLILLPVKIVILLVNMTANVSSLECVAAFFILSPKTTFGSLACNDYFPQAAL